ncbi:MAG: aminopeptidase P family protein [Clostridiaceae bacterium]|nr:aminopeptidase P family protein [Clostridiaceae bacterium]
MKVNDKIAMLRELMKKHGIDAYIITDSDPHMSEYVSEHYKARTWISGFTGSAGTVVVTQNESALWTDGRYHIQAEKQLKGTEIKLFKQGNPGVPGVNNWIYDNLKEGQTAGFCAKTFPVLMAQDLERLLSKKNIKINKEHDFISEIWTENRPPIPMDEIFIHDIKYSGKTAKEKIDEVRKQMEKEGADYYLLGSLDDIAWLFNFRGNDVPFVPVAASYALITKDEAFLFINGKKVPQKVREIFRENNVTVLEYDEVKNHLQNLKKGTIAFDRRRINTYLYDAINKDVTKKEIAEITTKLKAVKNETELENFKTCQIRDGVAMVKFLKWVEENVEKEEITEVTVSEKLKELRLTQPDCLGPSFATIAGYKDHGAMMHYCADDESKYTLKNEGVMVVDSGGQYLCGTTDITRTVVFENITDEERFDYTMVLKAHIGLASAKFLEGTTGSNLDILARKPLWDIGLDYKCGTGHGVGYCLSVHEGPQGFSQYPSHVRLEKNMNVTIEPGIYKEGKHGIRIENMYNVVEDEKTEYGQFYRFEVMTLCPISLRGIDEKLLTDAEKKWLNDYHKKVYEELKDYLSEDERAWLKENTREI